MEWIGFFDVGLRRGARGQALGESGDWVFAGCLGVSCILCHCEFLTHFNCGGLVLSDPSELDFLHAGLGIEVPRTVL